MPEVLVKEVLGTAVGVLPPPGTEAELTDLLSGLPDTTSSTQRSVAECDIARTVMALNALPVEAEGHLCVHAGAVAHGGDVVAFPAVSGTGKSTLTAACLRAGFAYVSDEALCLDRTTGAVTPFAKPLSLSTWSAGAVGLNAPGDDSELYVPPGALGAAVARPPLRLTHVVLLERGSEQPELALLPRPAGLALLIRNAFNHFMDVPGTVKLLGDLVPRLSVWRLRYGDPMAAAETLALRLGSGSGRT